MNNDKKPEDYYEKYPNRKSKPIAKAVIYAVPVILFIVIAWQLGQPGAVELP